MACALARRIGRSKRREDEGWNMKRNLIVLALSAALFLLSGCVGWVVYDDPYCGPVVYEPPPAPVVEAVTVCPGPGYVWVPGTWEWRGYWFWAGGSYVVCPHPGATWYGGYWTSHGGGWDFRRGHWR
jgi:hypothetical protein